MSWWSRIFGGDREPALPARARGPSAEEPGELKGGVKHGVWVEREDYDWRLVEAIYRDGVRQGPYRVWFAKDGTMRERGQYVAGHKHGVVETLRPDGTLVIRAEMRESRYDGVVQRFREDGSLEYERVYRMSAIWSGPDHDDWPDGKPRRRSSYVDGVLDGAYSEHHVGGAPKLTGAYARGVRIGAWRMQRADGTVEAEADFDASGAGTWRARGFAIPARGDDLPAWIELAKAWDEHAARRGIWALVELAADKLPEATRDDGIAWLAARIAEGGEDGPGRTTFETSWLRVAGDPRALLIDGIAVDHHAWSAEQVARIVAHAGRLRELSLDEVDIEGGVAALFPPGVAWPRLETLSLIESGDLDALTRQLATAPWTTRLAQLSLDGSEGLSEAAAVQLAASPHLGALRDVRLVGVAGSALAAALADSPWLDQLEELELIGGGAPQAIVAMLGKIATPALRRLELRAYTRVRLDGNELRALVAKTRRPKLESVVLEGLTATAKARAQLAKSYPDLYIRIDDDD